MASLLEIHAKSLKHSFGDLKAEQDRQHMPGELHPHAAKTENPRGPGESRHAKPADDRQQDYHDIQPVALRVLQSGFRDRDLHDEFHEERQPDKKAADHADPPYRRESSFFVPSEVEEVDAKQGQYKQRDNDHRPVE